MARTVGSTINTLYRITPPDYCAGEGMALPRTIIRYSVFIVLPTVLAIFIAEQCRYAKGDWSECDSKTNMRSRTLTLKKGDQKTCEPTKTMQKKCRKACRYERGAWSECTQNQMTRKDKLKPNSDASCEQTRQITKKCNGSKPTKGKGKTPRRSRQ